MVSSFLGWAQGVEQEAPFHRLFSFELIIDDYDAGACKEQMALESLYSSVAESFCDFVLFQEFGELFVDYWTIGM